MMYETKLNFYIKKNIFQKKNKFQYCWLVNKIVTFILSKSEFKNTVGQKPLLLKHQKMILLHLLEYLFYLCFNLPEKVLFIWVTSNESIFFDI